MNAFPSFSSFKYSGQEGMAALLFLLGERKISAFPCEILGSDLIDPLLKKIKAYIKITLKLFEHSMHRADRGDVLWHQEIRQQIS